MFREVMTYWISHLGGFVIGVVEHPRHDSCVEGAPGGRAKGGFHTGYHMSILDIWVGRDL